MSKPIRTDLERKYSETANEIEMLLNTIKTKLKKHSAKFKQNSTNWGYLGDLAHIREELNNIDDFFNP